MEGAKEKPPKGGFFMLTVVDDVRAKIGKLGVYLVPNYKKNNQKEEAYYWVYLSKT